MGMIDWQKWSDGIFERASAEKKPIFLWIDYFSCRTCAKMENESFQDIKTAKILNSNFIPVRVSREERPDIDRHFQRVFGAMMGKDEGWPLSIFIDAGKVPLYSASYLPEEARDGMMSLYQIAKLISKRYTEERETLVSKGKEVLAQLAPKSTLEATKIDNESLGKIFGTQLKEVYDEINHGFGEGLKYLHATTLQAALDCCNFGNRSEIADMVTQTLDTMLESRIWDSRDGGFYCCSLDETWQMPMRRKGLAENAMMSMVLLKAGIIKDQQRYLDAAYKIGDWALRDMKDKTSRLFITALEGDKSDKRVFASANAMMATALLNMAKYNDRFRPDAMGAVNTLMNQMLSGAELKHQLGVDDSVTFVEDYAALAQALIAADDLSNNENFSLSASEVANAAIRRFYNNGFWGMGNGEFDDPSPFADTNLSSPAAEIIIVLGRLSKDIDKAYEPFVRQTLAVSSYDLMRKPITMSRMTEAALLYHREDGI